MAGKLTNYAENKMLDHILKVASFTRPTALFLALCDADPTDAATGGSISEPSNGSYARQPNDDWGAAASRAAANDAAVTFDVATATWGIIGYFAILDTLTLATGNVIAYGAVTPARTISTADQLVIDIGDEDVSVDAGGASDFLANAMLDHLFPDTPLGVPTSIFVALATDTILDADTGTTISEPGENYARIQHDDFKIAAAGASSNSGTVVFAKATGGTWGTISHFAVLDSLATGNLLIHSAVTIEKEILVADTPRWADGSLQILLD